MTQPDVQRHACDRVADAERRLALLDIQVQGWSIWSLFRLHCGYELMGLPRGSRLPPSRLLTARVVLADLPRWLSPPRADLVVVAPASARQEKSGHRHTNLTLDFLAEEFPESIQLDDLNNAAFYRERNQVVVPPALRLWLPKILGMARARFGRPSPETVAAARELHRRLRDAFGPAAPDPDYIAGHVRRFLWETAFYRRLFERARARTLLVASYGYHSQVAGARAAGLATREYQHGFVDPESHFGYAWSEAAVPYAKAIPVSDTFLAYGRHWQEQLEQLPFWRGRVRTVGNVRIDTFREARRRQRHPRQPGEPWRLVWASDGICVAESVGFLRECLVAAREKNLPLQLTVTLHPAYEAQESHYGSLRSLDPSVRITSARSGASTLEEIARADLHLSISSTCHYEAIALGVPTVVAQLPTWEKVAPLVTQHLAFAAATGADVPELLPQLPTAPDLSAAEPFFAGDARTRFTAALRDARPDKPLAEIVGVP